MLPADTASSSPIARDYLRPDADAVDPLEDFELGGVAVGDASQGLRVRRWRCWAAASGDVSLQPDNGPAAVIFNQPGIQRITFAFDQLMRPTVVYQTADGAFLRWYDPVPAAFVVQPLGQIRDPKLSLDDKRPTTLGTSSDLILAYLRTVGSTSSLYYLQQRDRFETERELRASLPSTARLLASGMNRALRMQFTVL